MFRRLTLSAENRDESGKFAPGGGGGSAPHRSQDDLVHSLAHVSGTKEVHRDTGHVLTSKAGHAAIQKHMLVNGYKRYGDPSDPNGNVKYSNGDVHATYEGAAPGSGGGGLHQWRVSDNQSGSHPSNSGLTSLGVPQKPAPADKPR